MKEAQTTQEALNVALKEAQAWKAAALAAQAEIEKQKLLVSELLSLDDFSSSYTLKAERDQYKIAYEDLMSGDKLIICKSALAEIRAEAVEEFWFAGAGSMTTDEAKQYAESIRKGGAK